MEFTEKEKQFIAAVFRELRFAPEAADNAVLARGIIEKLLAKEEPKPTE
jgi:hypothetical protein